MEGHNKAMEEYDNMTAESENRYPHAAVRCDPERSVAGFYKCKPTLKLPGWAIVMCAAAVLCGIALLSGKFSALQVQAGEVLDADQLEELADQAGTVEQSNEETGYRALIRDRAGLLTEAEREQLLPAMAEMTSFGNAYFYTTDDSVWDTYNYSGDRYEEEFGTEPGSIFLIAMGSRQLYLYNEGSIKNTITSSTATSIVDRHYSLASDGDYEGCAEAVFRDIYQTLSGRLLFQPLRIITVLLLAVLIAVLINYLVMVNGRKRAAKIGDNLTVSENTNVDAVRGIGAMALGAAIAAFTVTNRQRYHISHSSGGSGGSGGGGGHSGGHSGGGHSGSGGGHGF